MCNCWTNIQKLGTFDKNNYRLVSISDCYRTPTHNHLIHKRTLNYFVKLAKGLSCVVSTYLCGALDCMFLSCHVCVFRVNSHPIVS